MDKLNIEMADMVGMILRRANQFWELKQHLSIFGPEALSFTPELPKLKDLVKRLYGRSRSEDEDEDEDEEDDEDDENDDEDDEDNEKSPRKSKVARPGMKPKTKTEVMSVTKIAELFRMYQT